MMNFLAAELQGIMNLLKQKHGKTAGKSPDFYFMFFVYILKEMGKENFYTGFTNNIDRRIFEHSSGLSQTTKNRKWKLFCYFAFTEEKTARNFEKYLKTGSGRAFSKKHFSFIKNA